jgi:hypothetical protein
MELVFTGRLGAIKVGAPKRGQDWSTRAATLEGGSIEVPFTVERPEAKRQPQPDYELKQLRSRTRPKLPKNATAEVKSEEEDEWREHLEELAGAEAQLAEELAAWQLDQANIAGDLRSYAQLAGIAALVGNMRCRITVELLETDLLPGFEPAALIPAPDVS